MPKNERVKKNKNHSFNMISPTQNYRTRNTRNDFKRGRGWDKKCLLEALRLSIFLDKNDWMFDRSESIRLIIFTDCILRNKIRSSSISPFFKWEQYLYSTWNSDRYPYFPMSKIYLFFLKFSDTSWYPDFNVYLPKSKINIKDKRICI